MRQRRLRVVPQGIPAVEAANLADALVWVSVGHLRSCKNFFRNNLEEADHGYINLARKVWNEASDET